MKVTTKKSEGFYIRAAVSFLSGVEAKQGVGAKGPVRVLKISGLGDAIRVAVSTAAAVESRGLGYVKRIETSYPEMEGSGRSCPRILVTVFHKALPVGTGAADHRERGAAGEIVVPEGGNLRFPVQQKDLLKAQEVVDRVHSGASLATALLEVGDARKPALIQARSKPRNLVVLYSDFELDDLTAIAQILEWKSHLGELEREPIVVFCADFYSKELGTIFEKKQLMAALMLGMTDIPVLTCEGGHGKVTIRDQPIHPKAKHLDANRLATLDGICDALSQFEGDRIDFYVMAPGHGNLGAIVARLRDTKRWPPHARWRVSMYTGSFNTRGMTDADLDALKEMVARGDSPLVDVSKFPFFGGADCHPVTASFSSFSLPSFGADVAKRFPLLAAVIVIFNREFNQGLIHPNNTSLFKGRDLDDAEKERFAQIKCLFFQDVNKYAQAIKADPAIWDKVVGYKKTTVAAFASGRCDAPLCDQVLFLHEWIAKEQPTWLAQASPGSWCMDKTTGFTTVKVGVSEGSLAIQPRLANPKDEAALQEIRAVLQRYCLQHVQALLPLEPRST
jgi:hypothetical protein